MVINSFDEFMCVRSAETTTLKSTLVVLSLAVKNMRTMGKQFESASCQSWFCSFSVCCRNGNGGDVEDFMQWSRHCEEFMNVSGGTNPLVLLVLLIH